MPDTQGNWSLGDIAKTIVAVELRVQGLTYAEIAGRLGLQSSSSGKHYVERGARRLRFGHGHGTKFPELRAELDKAISSGLIRSQWVDLQPA